MLKTNMTLEFYFQFRLRLYCCQRHVILLQLTSTKLRLSGSQSAELWRHIDFSRRRPQRRKSTSGFRFGDVIHLGTSKSICWPNFCEISQLTDEISLRPHILPFSKNKQPRYWDSVSRFDIGLWRYFRFWPAALDFASAYQISLKSYQSRRSYDVTVEANVTPPTKCNWWCSLALQIFTSLGLWFRKYWDI